MNMKTNHIKKIKPLKSTSGTKVTGMDCIPLG